jgi:hypothetical protein
MPKKGQKKSDQTLRPKGALLYGGLSDREDRIDVEGILHGILSSFEGGTKEFCQLIAKGTKSEAATERSKCYQIITELLKAHEANTKARRVPIGEMTDADLENACKSFMRKIKGAWNGEPIQPTNGRRERGLGGDDSGEGEPPEGGTETVHPPPGAGEVLSVPDETEDPGGQ